MKEMHSQKELSGVPEEEISDVWEELDVDQSGKISF